MNERTKNAVKSALGATLTIACVIALSGIKNAILDGHAQEYGLLLFGGGILTACCCLVGFAAMCEGLREWKGGAR